MDNKLNKRTSTSKMVPYEKWDMCNRVLNIARRLYNKPAVPATKNPYQEGKK